MIAGYALRGGHTAGVAGVPTLKKGSKTGRAVCHPRNVLPRLWATAALHYLTITGDNLCALLQRRLCHLTYCEKHDSNCIFLADPSGGFRSDERLLQDAFPRGCFGFIHML